jgi:hypothetical protein
VRIGGTGDAHRVVVEEPETDHLEDVAVNGMIILKYCSRLLRGMSQSAARDTAPRECYVWQSDARGRQPFIFMSI